MMLVQDAPASAVTTAVLLVLLLSPLLSPLLSLLLMALLQQGILPPAFERSPLHASRAAGALAPSRLATAAGVRRRGHPRAPVPRLSLLMLLL